MEILRLPLGRRICAGGAANKVPTAVSKGAMVGVGRRVTAASGGGLPQVLVSGKSVVEGTEISVYV
jgi:hypothetical protein